MSAVKRILVPTDFSSASSVALDYAILLAQGLCAEIHLLHVLEDRDSSLSRRASLPSFRSMRERTLEDARRQLLDSATRCAQAGVQSTVQASFGNPAAVIAVQASHRGAELIVMGAHGRSHLATLLLGSVAERVTRIAPCPVVTVRETRRVADIIAALAQPAATHARAS